MALLGGNFWREIEFQLDPIGANCQNSLDQS